MHDKSFGHSNLYLDFIGRDSRLNKYLISSGPAEAASKISGTMLDRDIFCNILEKQNNEFNSKPGTFSNIDLLRKNNTLCVFSGQQAGILGGPLYTIFKMIDSVKRAKILEKELGQPVVPMFWIACDDHDFSEINHTFSLDRAGQLSRIEYNTESETEVPVAEICLGDEAGYAAFKEQIESIFGGRDLSEDHLDMLLSSYSDGRNIVKAFAMMLNDILPDLGLIIFCPHNTEIKTLSKEFFKSIIEKHFETKKRLEDTENHLTEDHYHIQAIKKKSAVHLFYHAPTRTPIHYLDDCFIVGDKKLGLSGMLDLIEKYPERFSPDVLTRPIWQSFLFPVVGQIGGPSEIAYFCQIGNLFDLYNLVQPYYYSRANATIIEKRQEELLEKYAIKFNDFSGDIEQLFNRISSDSFPEDLSQKLEEFRAKFSEDYNQFTDAVLGFEKSLDKMADQTYGKIDYALKNFEKKIFSQHKKRMDVVRQQIYRLETALYPNHSFQERTLSVHYFISKYGRGIIDFIVDRLEVETTDHQLIYLREFGK